MPGPLGAVPVAPLEERVVTSVPFAGDALVVGEAWRDGRPVFGVSTLRRGPRALRPAPVVAAPAWPAHPLSREAVRDVLAARLPGARIGEGVVEGWVLRDGALVPAARVEVLLPGPTVWAVTVGADDGRPLGAEVVSRAARGAVYPENPLTSDVVVAELPGIRGDRLDGPRVRARSCDVWGDGEDPLSLATCAAFGQHATADAAGDFLFFPTPADARDPFGEVTLYFHADAFTTWLDERYGLRFPYAPIWANTNFPLANAFYGDFDLDGVPEVSFGTDAPTGTDFAYDADVVNHELGHAVVAQWAPGLPFLGGDAAGLEWAGGAVNEGIADVFSMIRTPDPLTGEFAGSAFGDSAIRDLERPRRCPDDLVGEVHADGEIFGSFGWQLVADPAVGPDLTAELLAGAVPRLGPDVSWDRIGVAVHEAADDLRAAGLDDAAYDAILAHLDASGMEGCGRVIPLDDGRRPELLLVNLGLLGPLARLPGGAQLSVDVPEAAQVVIVEISDVVADPGFGWAVYGRWDEPVGHDFVTVEALGLGFATPAAYDVVIDGDADTPAIVFGAPDGPELRPGHTLYLSLASVNQGTLTPLDFQYGALTVGATVVAPPGWPPRASAGACASAGPVSPLAGLLAVAALAVSRRGARAR